MKRYVLEVVIEEGNDEFWESIEHQTGCDVVLEWVKDVLDSGIPDFQISLKEYTDK